MVGLNFVYRRTLVTAGELAGDGHARGACCAGVVRVEYAPVVGVCRRRRGLAVMPSWALGFWLGRLAPFASMHVSHFVKLALYATYVDHEFLYLLFNSCLSLALYSLFPRVGDTWSLGRCTMSDCVLFPNPVRGLAINSPTTHLHFLIF